MFRHLALFCQRKPNTYFSFIVVFEILALLSLDYTDCITMLIAILGVHAYVSYLNKNQFAMNTMLFTILFILTLFLIHYFQK